MKKKLFDIGVRYFGQIYSEHEDCYLCPICFDLYNTLENLTLEHVPPESLGGVVLCLTCKSCNNNSGNTSEAHMHKEAVSRSLITKSKEWKRAKLTSNELTLNVSTRWNNDVLEFNGLPRNNDPKISKKFIRYLNSNPEDYSFKIESAVSFDQKISNAGYLKSAYLAAFAKFGYRYILKPGFQPMRDQILKPEEEILPLRRLKISGSEISTKKIYIVSSPVDSIVVKIRDVYLPLPGLNAVNTNVYDEFINAKFKNINQLCLSEMSWPSSMEMLADIQRNV